MINQIKDNWDEIINYMKSEFDINDVLFRTWILPLSIISYDKGSLLFGIDKEKQGDTQSILEKKYKVPFEVSIEVITGKAVTVAFDYIQDHPAKGVSSYNKEEMLEEKYPFLKQGHSFDTFVVSNSNNIAYNAAVAVAVFLNG